jgi:hypothetical protein
MNVSNMKPQHSNSLTANAVEARPSHLLAWFHSSQIVLPCIQNSMKEISVAIIHVTDTMQCRFLSSCDSSLTARPGTQQQTINFPALGDGTPYEESQNNSLLPPNLKSTTVQKDKIQAILKRHPYTHLPHKDKYMTFKNNS